MQAAIHKHIPVMQLLLNHGYNLQVQSDDDDNVPGYYYLLWFDAFVPYIQQLNNQQELIKNQGKELLGQASWKGALEHVKLLVQHGVNPSEIRKDGFTALHSAAAGNQLAVMRYFVEECNINPGIFTPKESRSPLHSAAYNGSREVFDYVSASIPTEQISACEARHGTVLHNAIVGGQLAMVDYLATKYPDLLTIHNNDNSGPLGVAVTYNKEEVLKLLIEKYKLNAQEERCAGRPLLHIAAEYGYLNLVKYFVEELHLDPLQKEQEYASAAHYAAASGELDILKYFLEDCGIDQEIKSVFSGETILHAAASDSYYPEVLDYLINQRKLNVNVLDNSNRVPLHRAATHGTLPCVRALIEEYKAPVDQADAHLVTPLMLAVNANRKSIVQYLLEVAKANIQSKTIDGTTIIHLACKHVPILNYLLNEHYSAIHIDAVDDNNNTAIHYLVRTSKNTIALKRLLQAGANPNIASKDGKIPVKYTSDVIIIDILDKFSRYKAEIFQAYAQKSQTELQNLARKLITFNIQDEQGNTLLHTAIKDNNAEMVTFLLTINREVAGVKNKFGETPVTLAYFNYRPMFELLWNAAYGEQSRFYKIE